LVGTLGGGAAAVIINAIIAARVGKRELDTSECEAAAPEDRASRCIDGPIMPLAIAQNVAFVIALISAGPLGYVLGYESAVYDHKKKLRATLLPMIDQHTLGLALGVQAL
jgi:hypothetical protein